MNKSIDTKELIEVVRWHIVRADGLRNGLWTRAAAILSANALVVAGTAVLASTGNSAAWWSLSTAVAPLIASMASIYEASNVISTIQGWSRTFAEQDSPTPVIYSAPDTVEILGTYDRFRAA